MSREEEVLEAVGKSRVISKLDVSKGYYQVPMRETDIAKTAFVCHWGGSLNSSECPSASKTPLIIDDKYCSHFAPPYMDDIVNLVSHGTPCLRKAGLTANSSKCCRGGGGGCLHGTTSLWI